MADVDNVLKVSRDSLNLLVAETLGQRLYCCCLDPKLTFIDGILKASRHADAESVPSECAVPILIYRFSNVRVIVVIVGEVPVAMKMVSKSRRLPGRGSPSIKANAMCQDL